jgi:hypothetical protein
MPPEEYLMGDQFQFFMANINLWWNVQNDPSLIEKLGLTELDFNNIESGKTLLATFGIIMRNQVYYN